MNKVIWLILKNLKNAKVFIKLLFDIHIYKIFHEVGYGRAAGWPVVGASLGRAAQMRGSHTLVSPKKHPSRVAPISVRAPMERGA